MTTGNHCPDWLPDWREDSEYPSELSLYQWQWQFLRRREDYQKDWDKYHDDWYAEKLNEYKNIPLADGVSSWKEHFKDIAGMPNAEHREKYKVHFLLNPSMNDCNVGPPGLFVNQCNSIVNFASQKSFDEMNGKGVRLYSFDLNKPIEPQLKKAKSHLIYLQEVTTGKPKGDRNHFNKWPLYLRVMDAQRSGATYQLIGEELLLSENDILNGSGDTEIANKAHQVWTAARNIMFKTLF